jgi:ABC-type glutathione transport system ATPase component
MIEASGLTKRYGSALAVNDLSFTIRPGVVTGFLGPNGAVKTTTMRMIPAWPSSSPAALARRSWCGPAAGRAGQGSHDRGWHRGEQRRRPGRLAGARSH